MSDSIEDISYYLNWHKSRYDGHSDTNIPAIFQKLEEGLVFKEQLCDNEISASIHLFL